MPDDTVKFHSIAMDEKSLSQNAAQQIRDLILSGELKVGDRLPSEHELGERLGVSRTVVREAVKLLKAAGMLEGRLGVGTYIARPATNVLTFPLQHMRIDYKKLLIDLQQVRLALEPPLAAMAAEHADPEHIAALEQAIETMQANLTDPAKFIDADNRFHLTLAKAARNSVLELFISSAVDLLQQARRLILQYSDAISRANGYHVEILKAVKARDSQRAQEAMEAHMSQINDSMQTTMQHLDQPEVARYFEQVH